MVSACLALHAAAGESVTTTVYIGRHFEVRDHDQPVKYVFNGDTRVASLTGSLSANLRVQRVRLYPGWNLLTLAVTATDLLQQLSTAAAAGSGGIVSAAYQWDSAAAGYSQVATGQTVSAGTVLWVRAETNAVAAISGAYSDPVNRQVEAGGAYVAGTGLEAWSPGLPPSTSAWQYDAESREWHAQLAGDVATASDPPPLLAPGQAMYVQVAAPTDLGVPDPTLRVRYYHPDHLGSSSVITDETGALVEETAFLPFGSSRHAVQPRQVREPYQFTQKERDAETGLHYFEARYLSGPLARFITPDPKFANPDALSKQELSAFLGEPQRQHPYAYVRNNPLTSTDPTGNDEKGPRRPAASGVTEEPAGGPGGTTLSLGDFGDIEVQNWSPRLAPGTITGSSGSPPRSGGDVEGKPGAGAHEQREFTITKSVDKSSTALHRAAASGQVIGTAEFTMRTKSGEAYLKVKLEGVVISGYQIGAASGAASPTEALTLNAGKVEYEYLGTSSENAPAGSEAGAGWPLSPAPVRNPFVEMARFFNQVVLGGGTSK